MNCHTCFKISTNSVELFFFQVEVMKKFMEQELSFKSRLTSGVILSIFYGLLLKNFTKAQLRIQQ